MAALLTAGGVLAAHALAICGLTTFSTKTITVSATSASNADGARRDAELRGSNQQALETPGGNLPRDDESADIFNDLGNLLLAFLMVNAYFAFSQFLIIWSGNLPSEITWYLRRLNGGWQWLALAIVILHFALPFLMLLSRDQKRAATIERCRLIACDDVSCPLVLDDRAGVCGSRRRGHAINMAGLIAIFGACPAHILLAS